MEQLKPQIAALPAERILEIEDLIHCIATQQVAEIALARRTNKIRANRVCPHCYSNEIVLNGKDQNGRQRFKCRGCRRSYNILTGTPMARARKPEKWGLYLGCMTEHMPLRTIVASGVGVHLVTAWRWRHRFLTAAANDNAAILSGLIQANTTFFQHSYKGSRGLNKADPRGRRAVNHSARGAEQRPSSPQLVPVLTALNSSGDMFEAILGSLTEIAAALDGRIAAGSVLCSDASTAYVSVADKARAEHYVIFVSDTMTPNVEIKPAAVPRLKPGRLGLRQVNNHHERLKYLVNEQCRGVATKYLWNYMGWHRAMIRPGFEGKLLLDSALQ